MDNLYFLLFFILCSVLFDEGSCTISSPMVEPSVSSTSTLETEKDFSRKKKLRVLLIRHGESRNNILMEIGYDHYREHRTGDPPLTDLGHKQAKATASYLNECKNVLLKDIEEVYVSPFLRTLQTAEPIVSSLNISPYVWPEIFEVGGVWEGNVGLDGLSAESIQLLYPTYKLPEDGSISSSGWYKQTKKETFEDAEARVIKVFETLKRWAKDCGAHRSDKTIALVVHGDFINLLLQVALGLEQCRKAVFHAYNTSFHLFDIFEDGNVSILFHNNIDHLFTDDKSVLAKVDMIGRL